MGKQFVQKFYICFQKWHVATVVFVVAYAVDFVKKRIINKLINI